jgi:hypothetical protein
MKYLLTTLTCLLVLSAGCNDTSLEYQEGYAAGVKEAKQEMANKTMTLYRYGTHPVPVPKNLKDAETGLPVKFIAGCLVTNKDTGRLKGHN